MRSEAIFFGSLTRLLLKDVNGQRAIFPVVWPKAPTVGATGLAPEVGALSKRI